MKKPLVIISILIALFVIAPVTALGGYNDILTPGSSGYTTISWEITDTPDVPFSLYWAGTEKWIAEKGSLMNFTVIDIHDDIEGELTLGNLTLTANDTELAQDLTLGVWGLTPFLPGLIIKNSSEDIANLIEIADQSAERISGNYLNGTMQTSFESLIVNGDSYNCVTFDYVQDTPSFGDPQRTFLAYDDTTGILVLANTSYSFGTPYSLVLELSSVFIPTAGDGFGLSQWEMWIVVSAVGIILIAFAIIVRYVKR